MPRADCSAATLEPALLTALPPVPPLWANAPPAAKVSVAAAAIAPVLRRRSRLRAWRASLRRSRDRRLDSSHGTWFDRSSLGTATPWVPGAYGVSCRARARNCATPHTGGDSPRGAALHGPEWVPRSRPGRPDGIRLGRSYEARHHSDRTGRHVPS